MEDRSNEVYLAYAQNIEDYHEIFDLCAADQALDAAVLLEARQAKDVDVTGKGK